MFEYIKGPITVLTPTQCVVEVSGVGYLISISLTTYSDLKLGTNTQLFIHPIYREDAQLLYGFITESERLLFRQLIGVSGVGANTARMMLSSLHPSELISAIVNEQVSIIKSVKGIGLKTAERIIVDLKDKLKQFSENGEIISIQNNTMNEEALSALMMLGFPRKSVEKVISNILKIDASLSVEAIIKSALKQL